MDTTAGALFWICGYGHDMYNFSSKETLCRSQRDLKSDIKESSSTEGIGKRLAK